MTKASKAKLKTLLSRYKNEFDFIFECERERQLILLELHISNEFGDSFAEEFVDKIKRTELKEKAV